MPISKVEGGWKASYAGKTATFKRKSDAEKWASKYTGKKKEVAAVLSRQGKPKRPGRRKRPTPRYTA